MVLKSKRSSFPTSTSTEFHPSSLSLQCFPPEILLMTFQNLDIPTLLDLCNVCKLFLQIGSDVLSRKFQDPKVGLTLTFEQEHKFKFDVPFEFWKLNEKNGNFIYRPTPSKLRPLRFVHSSVVRKPVLSKVSTVGITDSPSSSDPLGRTGNPSNPRSKQLEENLLQTSLPLTIKPHEGKIKKIRHAYRVGHGTTHLRIPYTFTYGLSNTPPPFIQRTRSGGERWLTPFTFECAPSFFYPREPIARQIIMTIIHLRKRNLTKKKPSNPPPPTNHLSKSKQKQEGIDINITVEEVDDFNVVSTNSNTNDRANLNPTTNRRLFERQLPTININVLVDLKKPKGSIKNYVRGPRS